MEKYIKSPQQRCQFAGHHNKVRVRCQELATHRIVGPFTPTQPWRCDTHAIRAEQLGHHLEAVR